MNNIRSDVSFNKYIRTHTRINTNGQDRRENGEGVARGTVKDNERCNDGVEEVDEIEVACPLCRGLLGIIVAVLTTEPP